MQLLKGLMKVLHLRMCGCYSPLLSICTYTAVYLPTAYIPAPPA